MGQVYQATDTKLNRQVALKILPEAFATDPDRLARFQREAQVLASLNHPGIAAIYGIEEQDDTRALVLELVEGPTLADRISQGPIPVDEALPIAKQIAEALEAAHEAGVIHRDLKPANIKVRDDGTVKVLDFGLAKALDTSPEGDPSQSPTLTAAATQMGVIMGTAAYMSPEQARGKPVDKRADIWAFGVVLYEMLAGSRPFKGEDVSLTLASVMKSEFNVAALPVDMSETIRTVIRQCLQKDPKRRIRDVGDVKLAMEGVFDTAARVPSEPTVEPTIPVSRRPVLALGIGLAVLLLGVAIGNMVDSDQDVFRTPVRFAVSAPAGERLDVADNTVLAISPDGTLVAYLTGVGGVLSQKTLQVQSLDGSMQKTLATGALFGPFFSPDSEWVGIYDFAERELRRISVESGAALRICDVPGALRGASWGSDGTIIFATPGGGLWQVVSSGGTPEQLTTPEGSEHDLEHFWPAILPGGRVVLYTAVSEQVVDSQIVALSLETGERKVVVQGGFHARYSPSGHLVYGVESSLLAVGFDLDELEVMGSADAVVDRIVTKPLGGVEFSISDNGRLIYVSSGEVQRSRVSEGTLIMLDRDGTMLELPSSVDRYVYPRFSPDGSRLAVQIDVTNGSNIFVYEMATNRLRQLTFDGGQVPLWTPDGTHITFLADDALWNISADFGGQPQLLSRAGQPFGIAGPYSWSPDGKTLFWEGVGGVFQLTLSDQAGVQPDSVLVEPRIQDTGFSADGRWFSYSSGETGRSEIYVQPYPSGSGAKRRITAEGGADPIWSRGGDELFYAADGQLWSVRIATEPALDWQDPVTLFEVPWRTGDGSFRPSERRLDATAYFVNYDVTADGTQFVFVQPLSAEPEQLGQISVVLNWDQELLERVPVD